MTLSNELIEPQQWYRWHNRGERDGTSSLPEPRHPRRFHFGDLVVRELPGLTDAGGPRLKQRGYADVGVTFRCQGIVRIEGEDLTMAQLDNDESLLDFTVRVRTARADEPTVEIVAQFMTGDFAGLDTADPSAALTDFELRAKAEALAFLQRDGGLDAAGLARQLGVSGRRLNSAFRNTGNSVRATLRCE